MILQWLTVLSHPVCGGVTTGRRGVRPADRNSSAAGKYYTSVVQLLLIKHLSGSHSARVSSGHSANVNFRSSGVT